MVTLRFAIPATLAAATVAGCYTYFVTQPAWVEADAPLPAVRLPPAVLYSTGPNARTSTAGVDQPSNADEQAAAAYQKAAEGRAPNTRASAIGDELPMTGRIPLPKKRPIAR